MMRLSVDVVTTTTAPKQAWIKPNLTIWSQPNMPEFEAVLMQAPPTVETG
jgi:hypothetical protein